MAQKKKPLSPAKAWQAEIYDAMNIKAYSKVKQLIEANAKKREIIEDDNYYTATKQIWWRIINSAKRQRINMHDYRASKEIMDILSQECHNLPINNKQKRIVEDYIAKYDIPTFPAILTFLNTPNKKDFDDRSPYLNNKDKAKIFNELISNTAIPYKQFIIYTEDMFKFFDNLPTKHSDLIDLTPLCKRLNKTANKEGIQESLFIDYNDKKTKNTIDKECFLKILELYSKTITSNDRLNPHFHNKFMSEFGAFVSDITRENSFTREESKKQVRSLKKHRAVLPNVERHLNHLSYFVISMHDYKQDNQIKELNEWFKTKNKEKESDKDVLLRTYISLLDKRLVEDVDITSKEFDNEYKIQKKSLKDFIFEETGKRSQNTTDLVRQKYVKENQKIAENINLTLNTVYSKRKRLVNSIRKNLSIGISPSSNAGKGR